MHSVHTCDHGTACTYAHTEPVYTHDLCTCSECPCAHMCIYRSVHTIHTYMPVSCMYTASHRQMWVHAHSLFVIHMCTCTYSSMLHAYQKHTPYSSRKNPSTSLLSTRVLFAFFKQNSRLGVSFYSALYVAVHEALRERLTNIQLTYAPMTLSF